jgi:hypothetical protein
LPQGLPFLVGPLTECRHCVRTYLGLFAGLPATVPVLKPLGEGFLGRALAVLATLTLVALIGAILRRWWRGRAAIVAVVAGLSALHAIGLASLLRA